jgi:hypothetical protein
MSAWPCTLQDNKRRSRQRNSAGPKGSCSSALAFQTQETADQEFPIRSRHSLGGQRDSGPHDIALRDSAPDRKSPSALLTFSLCSPRLNGCANGCDARFAFDLCPSVAPTNAAMSSALVCLEQRTEPQVCATRLHSDDQPQSKSARCGWMEGSRPEGRAQVHAAPGSQTDSQSERLMSLGRASPLRLRS